MSYLVLARRWRPQGFEDLIGQEPISRILSNAITQGKIAHAYLFSGPRGVGKTSTARILAKALNCEKGPTHQPCGKCISCAGIADGSSVDVMEIDGASNNSVNDIRDLRERVKYAPAGGRYKVYIIDEAHMLSDAAFNALLKTLEEPPPHVVFVLATTAPRKVPATVLSRCQHLPFRKIPLLKIKERLRMISDSEGIRISDAAIDLIARASEGGMRDSLTILDQVSAFSSDIEESEVKDLLGITDFRALSGLATAVVKGDRKQIVGLISKLADTGTDLKSFAKDLMQFFRDLLVAKVVSKPEEILDVSEGEMTAMREILSIASEDLLTLLLSEMIKAEADARFAFSPRVALEMALIKASFLSMLKPVQEAIENIESFVGERKGHPESASEVPGRPATVDTEEPQRVLPDTTSENQAVSIVEEEVRTHGRGSFTEAFLKRLESANHLLSIKLSEAETRVDGDTLEIIFNGGSAIHADSVKKNIETVRRTAEEILGRKVSVRLDTAKKKVLRKKELKEKALSEPLIKEAIELFDGRIVDIKPMDGISNGGNGV